MDLRVKAVALVAGAYNITDTYREFLGEDGFATYPGNLNESRQRWYRTGELEYMPAIDGKQLQWIETTNHVELYDRAPYVTQAVDYLVAWLDEHLARTTR
jgi:fermentation-respiration switch protein FrsA (DUF1100 family)